MPITSFLAAHDDQVAVLDYLLKQTDLHVFESCSGYEQPLREFSSASEIAETYQLGEDAQGNGVGVCLVLWSPTVMPLFPLQRIELNPASCKGHTCRYKLDEHGGIFVLIFGGICGDALTRSRFESTTRTWVKAPAADLMDWDALAKLAREIDYHISHKLAVAKAPGRPVLRQALHLAQTGTLLRDLTKAPSSFNDRFKYSSRV